MTDRLHQALAALPAAFPGPGGAVAVLQDGAVLARHAWGWANAERRIPFTPQTLFRICSITKQFTCALVLDQTPDPSVLDPAIRARLPNLQVPAPGALHLCHNQSGLRDYWALAMLHGAPAESAFGDTEAARVIAGTRTLHFAPGTRYSYANQNFRILADALQDRTGRSYAELLRTRIFDPAGMPTALLAADTRAMPDGTEGYEGTQATGFRPAENRIVWTGDAGIGASLNDMIAWEQWIDRTRHDPASLYQRLAAPTTFADGAPAPYGHGLGRRSILGRPGTAHGGALRGWRGHRLLLTAERISVVVLFNHMADAQDAALRLLTAMLDDVPTAPAATPPDCTGTYLEPETNLVARIDGPRLRYGQSPELLTPDGTQLRPTPDGLWMDRPQENQSTRLEPLHGAPIPDIAGTYRCQDLDATLTLIDAGGVLYGACTGMLGQGRMDTLEPAGPDTWLLPCPRALDHTPPGDWTIRIHRNPTGTITGLHLGCWLARNLSYERADDS